MPILTVRVTDEELAVIKNYAKINNCTISDFVRKTMLEKIESEFDLNVFAEYEKEKAEGEVSTRPISELWNELAL